MAYELWETRTSNMIADFPTEQLALDAVREAIEIHGRAYVEMWGLAYEDQWGRTKAIAHGDALVDRALNTSKV